MNNLIKKLRFVQLNLDQLKLVIFINAVFVNTLNLHSQIDYVVCLIDDHETNVIYWSFIKCKRIIKNVLTTELYVIINDFDVDSVIKSTIEQILKLNNSLSLILCINLKSLYDCLIKLDIINEKRLIIDLFYLKQSYKRKKVAEIRWIDDIINSTDVMTKLKFCSTLIKFININIINVKTIEWINFSMKRFDH